MLYLTALIRDIDNPFDYYMDGVQGAQVSLKPIDDLQTRLAAVAAEVAPGADERVAASA